LAKVRIHVVVDNYAERGLLSAWGLSLYVETSNVRILFDFGPDPHILEYNSKKLGLDPKSLDFAVLSHYHVDHFGGAAYVAQEVPGLTTYVPPGPQARLVSLGLNPVVVEHSIAPAPGVFIAGPMRAGFMFYEIALLLTAPAALAPVLVVGCSHPGVVKVVKLCERIAGQKLFAVVGGMHMPSLSELEYLAKRVEVIYPLHCSGLEAVEFLRSRYPSKLGEACAGTTISL